MSETLDTNGAEASASYVSLYRATCAAFAIGERIIATARTPNASQGDCDAMLAAPSPSGSHDRRRSVFASDSPEFPAYYLRRGARGDCTKRLYRVEMPSSTRHPMVLVNALCNAVDPQLSAALAREYWQPIESWACWEYIAPKMTVIAEEPWPDVVKVGIAATRYQLDLQRAKAIRAS